MQSQRQVSNLNVPNVLTFVRIICALLLPFFWVSGIWAQLLWGGAIFTLGSITDYADGKYARRYNVITKLGKIADPIADKLLTLGAMFVLAALGVLPMWAIILIAAREIGVTVLRFYALNKGETIAAVSSGKQKTFLQIVLIYAGYVKLLAMQLDSLPSWSMTALDGLIFVFLILALWQTLYSGYDIWRNNKQLLG